MALAEKLGHLPSFLHSLWFAGALHLVRRDIAAARERKQRHTSKRMFERLRDEHGHAGGITIVKDYVRAQRLLRHREVFVPLRHDPGHAQVDFGEALAEIAGVEQKIHFFAMAFRVARHGRFFWSQVRTRRPGSTLHARRSDAVARKENIFRAGAPPGPHDAPGRRSGSTIAENGFAHLRAASAGRGRVERPSKAGVASRARPLKFIPKLTELACVELTRRDEIANPRRALRSGPRAVSTAKSSLFL